jgi:type II secretion system protein H
MLPSRQSNSSRGPARCRLGGRGFTLIELIFVMVLLAIGAAMVAPSMASFYRGRLLSSEAKRLLALVHYGQSRAIAEGVPVLLWINAKDSTYGLRVPSTEVGGESEGRPTQFTADETVKLDTPATDTAPVSEQDDEKLGITDGLPVIRFTPDGFYDESSVRKITLRQGDGNENALEVVQTANRLGYEIRPATAN